MISPISPLVVAVPYSLADGVPFVPPPPPPVVVVPVRPDRSLITTDGTRGGYLAPTENWGAAERRRRTAKRKKDQLATALAVLRWED